MRTQHSLAALTRAAAEPGVVFAGAVGGGYVFPHFLPAYDAVASLAKLLELLAPVGRPLSELVADLPDPTLVHRRPACPWSMKGTVMRVLNEQLNGRELDLTDGIKVLTSAAGPRCFRMPTSPSCTSSPRERTPAVSQELERVRELVEDDPAGRRRAPRTSVKASS